MFAIGYFCRLFFRYLNGIKKSGRSKFDRPPLFNFYRNTPLGVYHVCFANISYAIRHISYCLGNISRRRPIDIPRTFCNSPYISCSIDPSKYTSRLHNRAPFPRRNRDKALCPCTPLPIRQSVFRKFCICTVKTASSSLRLHFHSYYTPFSWIWQDFFPYKTAFPSKKLSKNPPTSKPVFSKQPIKSAAVAFLNL